MTELLPALAGAYGDRTDAVSVDGVAASWGELAAASAALAARIAGASAVALLATSTMDSVVGVLAGLRAGVPVVPIPPDAGTRERRHILSDAGPEALLAPAGTTAPDDVAVPIVPIDRRARGTAAPPPPPAGSAPGLILYTSGTTGAPKGVVLSTAAIAADLDALTAAWDWTPDDVLVHGLPLFHVHGLVLGVLGALRVGCRLIHTGRPTPDRYAAAGGTLYFGVPTIWSRICREPAAARALRGARALVSGSAALPGSVFTALCGLTGHRPIERYGMTETLITVSARAHGPRRPGWVGAALPRVLTRLVDEDGRSVPHDGSSVGELLVQAPTLFDGYLHRPEATAACYTADGWFRTGDAASIGSDGTHRILGRTATDLISSGGYRIGAAEVEDALLAHPAVRQAAVVGVPDADLGERIVAYVVADGVSERALCDFVATELSVHKRPREIRFVPELPRNALGKVLKNALRS